ncbi:MAG: hypothetical protein FWE25_07715 [Lachnospiraceae bacterium]|nr:hypothetical protein [Lachnospiraceae bacterium]
MIRKRKGNFSKGVKKRFKVVISGFMLFAMLFVSVPTGLLAESMDFKDVYVMDEDTSDALDAEEHSEELEAEAQDNDLRREDAKGVDDTDVLEPAYVDIVATSIAEVSTSAQLTAALNNTSVTEIVLLNHVDFAPTSGGFLNLPVDSIVINRNLTINGNGNRINMRSTFLRPVPQRIELANMSGVGPANVRTLRLNNVSFTRESGVFGTSSANGSIIGTEDYFLIPPAGAYGANWTIIIENNVSTGTRTSVQGAAGSDPNTGSLINAPRANVVVSGANNVLNLHTQAGSGLFSPDQNHQLNVRNLTLNEGASLHVQTTSTTLGNAGAAIHIHDGNLNVGAGALLHVRNNGSMALLSDIGLNAHDDNNAPTLPHGIYGSIVNTNITGGTLDVAATAVAYRSRVAHTFNMMDGAVMYAHSPNALAFVASTGYRDSDGFQTGTIRMMTTANSILIPVPVIGTGLRSVVNISGANTRMHLTSYSSDSAFHSGVIRVSGPNSELNVTDGADLNVVSTRTTAVQLHGYGISLNARSGANVNMVQYGAASFWEGGWFQWFHSTLRFASEANGTLEVDNATVTVLSAPGSGGDGSIRFINHDNTVRVINGGVLDVQNRASGPAVFFDIFSPIFAPRDRTQHFIVEGAGSEANLWSNTIALDVQNRANSPIINISAGPGTIFVVSGSSSGLNGVFNTDYLRMHIDNPAFFDFRNRAGNRVFNTSSGNTSSNCWWTGVNTDFAVWRTHHGPGGGPDALDGPPYHSWMDLQFDLNNINFHRVHPTNNPNAHFVEIFGDSHPANRTNHWGAERFARFSADNSPPEVDWLRIPTNADQRIFGHVRFPQGLREFRSARDGEVYVEVVITNAAGVEVQREWVTTQAQQMWDEPFRQGLFTLEFRPDGPETEAAFLPEGYTVSVASVRRGSVNAPRYVIGTVLADPVVSRDVRPPAPVAITGDVVEVITGDSQLSGTAEPGARIFVAVDHVWIMDGAYRRYVRANAEGNWTFHIADVDLEEGQIIAIYATSEQNTVQDIIASPHQTSHGRGIPTISASVVAGGLTPTYTGILGNINPTEAYVFHDATFPRRTQLDVIGGVLEWYNTTELIDFGSHVIGADMVIDILYYYVELSVRDRRPASRRGPWEIRSILSDGLYNEIRNHTLYDALVYNVNGTPLVLDSVQIVHLQTQLGQAREEITVISDLWSSTVGPQIRTQGANVRLGTYTGEVEWVLFERVD